MLTNKFFIISFFYCYSIVAVAQLSDSCLTNVKIRESTLRKAAFAKMYVPGKKIANVLLGTKYLYNLNGMTVLVFWKTDCPFCTNLIGVLKEVLQQQTANVKIIAVCLDTDKSNWQQQEFVKLKFSNLINLCDGQGFLGEIATVYHVYATPTMLLLDKNHCFIKLPKNVEELRGILNNKM
jgi:thioredoxin-related protein